MRQFTVPTVERLSLTIDRVKRGELLRQVRGPGTLVPEEVMWLPATTEGLILRTPVLPGEMVRADTVIMELSNPQLQLAADEAEWRMKSAEADLLVLQTRQRNELLTLQSAVTQAEANYTQAKVRWEISEALHKEGLESEQNVKLARVQAEVLAKLLEVEKNRLVVNEESAPAQLAAQRARVEEARSQLSIRQRQVDSLRVRAGFDGVLEQLPVEVGQRVTPGTTLAKVSNPRKLKAVVRVPPSQAPDVRVGQPTTIDARSGTAQGRVTRVDPGVQDGAVKVDVTFVDALPSGARPDLTVDGTIEVDRVPDTLFVSRPVSAQSGAEVSLFRLEPDGIHASRVTVRFGRTSVNTVEVLEGLREGESIVLSDLSQFESAKRIRLR